MRPYNSPLLDEIHRLFPQLLYNNNQFNNTESVFSYINEQINRNFNIFARERDSFLSLSGEQPIQEIQTNQHLIPIGHISQLLPINNGLINIPPFMQQMQQMQQMNPIHPIQEIRELNTSNPNIPQEIRTQLDFHISSIVGLMRNISGVPMNNINLLGFSQINHQQNEETINRPTQDEINNGSTIETVNGPFENICSICHESFTLGNTIRILNVCHHVYHMNCIDEWFTRNVLCPICRHDIRTQ
jgi:hypothetical protein